MARKPDEPTVFFAETDNRATFWTSWQFFKDPTRKNRSDSGKQVVTTCKLYRSSKCANLDVADRTIFQSLRDGLGIQKVPTLLSKAKRGDTHNLRKRLAELATIFAAVALRLTATLGFAVTAGIASTFRGTAAFRRAAAL